MVDAPTPQAAETKTADAQPPAPRVSVIVTVVEGADLDAALATVRRQAYEPRPEIVIVGHVGSAPDDVTVRATLEEAITAEGSDTDYLWLLHSDARPRPDALAKLVAETERNEASLAGSKLLVAGTNGQLESVGSATDVFGEPYSGLEEGEIDLQQYDVVREVAFVRSASMLVRRDLAQGLKGLDVLLPPVAAGLDFSQRARLAGGRVIIVPSSEVFHQGRCDELGKGWREQAGRLRAMLTAYSPLTLLWLVPYEFLISVIDSVGSLLLPDGRPAVRHVMSWLWNAFHLPSTLALRRRFRPVRSAGDEELFRFQARGSVRLRDLGSVLSTRVLLVFDDDRALARSTRRIGASPGLWGAVVAGLIVLIGVRGLILTGVPDGGFSFPFESPSTALARWFGGWNQTGLGSPAAVHPSVGLTGAVAWLALGAEGAARTLTTLAFGVIGVIGMGRLAGRLGVRGPGRYLAGLVAIGGPGVAALTGAGSWLALGAASMLPWAVRAAAAHPGEDHSHLTRFGWAIVTGLALGSLSPVLAMALVPLILLWRLMGGREFRVLLGLTVVVAAGVTSAAFLVADPGWALQPGRRLGLELSPLWLVLVAIAAVPTAFLDNPARRLGLVGGVLSLTGLVLARLPYWGPGVEEASLVLAAFGAALVVGAGLNSFSTQTRRMIAVLTSLVVLSLSVGPLFNGRLGLAAGEVNERLGFVSALAGEEGPGRVLVASAERSDIPGEARPGPGFWYRVIDGGELTLDEAWLAPPLAGDERLFGVLQSISSGSQLRPGSLLAPFAVDWVFLLGPEFRLDAALVAQLDLIPTPLDLEARVFENAQAVPIADAGPGSVWTRSGTGFSGEPGPGRVALAVNHDPGWGPDAEAAGWSTTVSASTGAAVYEGDDTSVGLAMAVVGLLVASGVLIAVGRMRR